MNGIVAMTKTTPKTGRSSLRPRRSCLLRADQLLLIRSVWPNGPDGGGVASAAPSAPPEPMALIG